MALTCSHTESCDINEEACVQTMTLLLGASGYVIQFQYINFNPWHLRFELWRHTHSASLAIGLHCGWLDYSITFHCIHCKQCQCTQSIRGTSGYGTRKISVRYHINHCSDVMMSAMASNRRLNYLLNRLFRHRSKKTSKLRVTGLCEGNSPVTGEFPAQRSSNAENVSIWWRHHVK